MAMITEETRQHKLDLIYNFIKEYINKNEYSPSLRDISEGTKIKSLESIYNYLRILRDDGKITFLDKAPRTIRIKK